MKNEKLWTYCKIAFGILAILTFTPLVTPEGVHLPTFAGMPYTLWVGILQAFLMVGLTWIATQVQPGSQE